MQTLHISHNDLDGLGCGILIKKFMSGNIKTAYLGYDDIDRYIEDNYQYYDRIIITDVSPQYGTVEMLAGEKDVLIIDHHASSEALKDFHFTYHNITKCATLLTYEYLLKELSPEQLKRFEEMDKGRTKLSTIQAYANFEYGFKLGAMLMNEVFSNHQEEKE